MSRVLNGVTTVRLEIAKRVQEAVEKLSYQSNVAGRNLRMGIDFEFGPDFELRSRQYEDVKRNMAQFAVQWVTPSDVVILDSGSTVAYLVSYLPEETLVYTNSLAILQPAAKRQLSVHLAPGLYVPNLAAVFGEETESYFRNRKATKYFFSSARVDVQKGLFNVHQTTCNVKQVILEKADMSILLVDHSKFCDADLPAYAPLSQVDLIITDYVPEPFIESLQETGVQFVEVNAVSSDRSGVE
ncbi:LacI family DNA-binding transcriptional regulator [Alicyclobacillaceae bacterium I2511]|nr:LacI family DNA-binding transcriptional regulator [Alicyclobacillaceae bacterium I2511]